MQGLLMQSMHLILFMQKSIGVNIDELYISQPDSGDQALEIAETMVRSGAMEIIVIDSVAALVPKQEIEGDMGDSHVGLQARLMSQALRKLTPVIVSQIVLSVFINQLRAKSRCNVWKSGDNNWWTSFKILCLRAYGCQKD
mgnify:CR=1 FL=1